MLNPVTDQEQEFADAGIDKSKRPTWLKWLIGIIISMLTTSVTFNFYQLRQAQNKAYMVVELQSKCEEEKRQMENTHKLEMQKATEQFNNIAIELLKRQLNMSIKIDTTLNP